MNKKYVFLISLLFLFMLTAVSAQENSSDINGLTQADIESIDSSDVGDEIMSQVNTDDDSQDSENELSSSNSDDEVLSQSNDEDKLEKTSYYDANDDQFYDDDTVIAHNVVKYYGDTTTKFKIKVYDNDYNLLEGVDVSFGKWGVKKVTKTTNNKGIVIFPINYGVGQHVVISYIDCEDGASYFTTNNLVTIKSTIVAKTFSKYVTQKNKKLSVKFLNSKGKALKHKIVKIKIKGKTYKLRTNSKGIVKITTKSFKVGKHKITAYNPVTKEKRKITVKIKAKKRVVKVKTTKKHTTRKFSRSSSGSGSYIGNKNTHKFHRSSCSYVGKMKSSNKIHLTRSQAISWGYSPCKRCNP